MFALDELTLMFPEHLCLPISADDRNAAWLATAAYSDRATRWNAYLNRLALQTLCNWWFDGTHYVLSWDSLPSIWEFVNGCHIARKNANFVLITSEDITTDEFAVPQEWVDIPSWAAHYYLAVQINQDWLRVWGYTTHHLLKSRAAYDRFDRCYVLASSELIPSWNVLELDLQAGMTESPIVPQLTSLSASNAMDLIDQLSQLSAPRLAIAFDQWAALLENDNLRQMLYEHRRQKVTHKSSILDLLRAGISQLGRDLGWQVVEFQPSLAGTRGTASTLESIAYYNSFVIAGQTYELRVIPASRERERSWRFELRNAAVGGFIPGGFKLRLLTKDGEVFDHNEDVAKVAVEQLDVEVILEAGEAVLYQIEPIPEGYQETTFRYELLPGDSERLAID